jgi:hypothetical protein
MRLPGDQAKVCTNLPLEPLRILSFFVACAIDMARAKPWSGADIGVGVGAGRSYLVETGVKVDRTVRIPFVLVSCAVFWPCAFSAIRLFRGR